MRTGGNDITQDLEQILSLRVSRKAQDGGNSTFSKTDVLYFVARNVVDNFAVLNSVDKLKSNNLRRPLVCRL